MESALLNKQTLNDAGFSVLPPLVTTSDCQAIHSEMASAVEATDMRRGGIRNALAHSQTARLLVASDALKAVVSEHLGPGAFPVRAIFFDKTPDANWLVPWHQDTTIAVDQRIETPGYGPWSTKDGVPHVQPPASVLANMLTTRLHTDACGVDNGPLRVLPGSHKQGIQTDKPAALLNEHNAADEGVVDCLVDQGGVVLMKPLLWHASSKATVPGHRRVLHVEWAAAALPNGLSWCSQWPHLSAHRW